MSLALPPSDNASPALVGGSLTPLGIAHYAAAAGFSGADLTTAVAICLAESRGESGATHNNSDGSTDYGLWQINSVHGQILAQGNWADPASNAKMAFAVYSDAGRSFRPWSTYNSGAYNLYMPMAVAATHGITTTGVPVTAGSGSAGSSLAKLGQASTWVRVGEVLLGAALIIIGIYSLVKDTPVAKAATKAAEVGAML